ncbi:TetR/AcrR family transcriptional regulator [Sphingomonas sp. GB1N7]|uniref:TetR/AcrR family transcriptional regulator n=1 Tax=Parasphingomonas caseinilytica TaxID=3096158 RepID=UPI002FC7024A
MSSTPIEVPKKRRKRGRDEARGEALTAARILLLRDGPSAVTVANVGRDIGMSHTNVIHHFGSAAGLQSALMGSMIADLTTALEAAATRIREDATAPRALVDTVFDAFAEGGAGQLAAWIALARDFEHLEPVRDAVQSVVSVLVASIAKTSPDGKAAATIEPRVKAAVLMVATLAFGDAVIGPHLRAMLECGEDEMRGVTAGLLPLLFPWT